MKVQKVIIVSALIAVLALASLFTYQSASGKGESVTVYEVSVIIADSSFDKRENLKQGLQKASSDFNAETSLIYLGSPNDPAEQAELIRREVSGGADAILIEALNDPVVTDAIEEASKTIPVIVFDSAVADIYLSSDNYAFGQRLAEKIIADNAADRTVTLIKSGFTRSSIELRYQGVFDTLTAAGYTVENWQLSEAQASSVSGVSGKIKYTDTDIIIAFDTKTLETLAEAKEKSYATAELRELIRIYGFGHSSTILQYMENDTIKAIGLVNEYSYGYIGIKMAVDILKGKSYSEENSEVFATYIIDREEMFNEENQRILFPFGQ